MGRVASTILAAVAICAAPAFAQGVAVGDPAPDFTLAGHDGAEVSLSDLRGNVVVLEWTNPDCPYVQRHYNADTMEELASATAGDGVVWLAVNSSHYATQASNAGWAAEQKLAYPVLDDSSGDVGRAYGARTTPHVFVIDEDGVVVYAGGIDDDPRGESAHPTPFVANAIAALLEGEPVPVAESRPYGCSVKYQ